MSEFDMKITGCTFNPMSTDYRVGYESGVKSQQAKIDEFQKLRSLDEMEINQLAQANQVWQIKCDELQKQVITQGQNFNDLAQKLKDLEYMNKELQGRIGEALTYLRHTDFRECKESILFNILKGNKDEN